MWTQILNYITKYKSALIKQDNNNCDSWTVALVIKFTIREICVWKNK